VFLDHFLRVNDKKGANNLYVSHQFNYENKFFDTSSNGALNSRFSKVIRFGDSYVASGINDQTHYNKMYNKLGLTYENTTWEVPVFCR
jgi:hypothetical protein